MNRHALLVDLILPGRVRFGHTVGLAVLVDMYLFIAVFLGVCRIDACISY